MVLALLGSLAGFVKVRFLTDKAIIDNPVARLHYRFTSAMLFLGCLLCTANALIGNPIECIWDNENLKNVINTYCWITATFTLTDKYNHAIAGKHVPYPGVGPHVEGDKLTYHLYYQWVPFALFFQGILFYAPHWFWKNWEEGKMHKISEGMRGTLALGREERQKHQTRLVNYITEYIKGHNTYALGYFLCEILNFVNVIGNIYLTDLLLGGAFLTYGRDVMFPPDTQISPFERVFPRIGKCTFHYFGPSGSLNRKDHMCVLALNIINEKIYIFLWFWFIILAVASGIALLYSIAIIASPTVRCFLLRSRFKFRSPQGVHNIVDNIGSGDFILLHLLGQNLNSLMFKEVLEELSNKLNGYSSSVPSAVSAERIPIYPTKESFLPH